jgi:hypothetical protein
MTVMILLAILLLVAMYLSPTMIAVGREARWAWAIAALNFFLGWTLIGWIAAFIWSLLATSQQVQQNAATEDAESGLELAAAPAFGAGDMMLFRRPLGEPRA